MMPREDSVSPSIDDALARVPPLFPGVALFLDFDGTLAPFADSPDRVVVAPYISSLLLRVRSYLHGALALISGRPIQQLDRLTGWSVLAAAGIHGLERRDAGGRAVEIIQPGSDLLASVKSMLQQFQSQHPRLLVEDKGVSVALHYRRAPDLSEACTSFAERLLPNGSGLELVRGDMVLEFKPRSHNKGTALRAFLCEPPFVGRKPFYIGDDLNDEPAFLEARRLGGMAAIVGSRAETAANFRFTGVQAVHNWLNTLGSKGTDQSLSTFTSAAREL